MDQVERDGLLAKANAQYTVGRLEEALELYRAVLQHEPENAWAHSRIGAILAQMADPEGAEAALSKAIEIDPKLPQAHSNLGNIYYQRGDYQAALQKYKDASTLDPSNPVFLENMHAAYKKLGKLSDAVAALKQAHRAEREGARREAKANFEGMKSSVRKRIGCLPLTLGLIFILTTWMLIA